MNAYNPWEIRFIEMEDKMNETLQEDYKKMLLERKEKLEHEIENFLDCFAGRLVAVGQAKLELGQIEHKLACLGDEDE